MVTIGRKPILWHIMKLFSHFGYNDFILALGYKGDYIKQYFLNQDHVVHDFTLLTKSHHTKIYRNNDHNLDDFKITFVDTGQETLPGERILRIQEYIPKKDKLFMVTYGDGVADINIKQLVRFHKKQGTLGTVTGIHPRSKYGLLSVDSSQRVNKFIEKPVLEDWVNGGFMLFGRGIFSYIKEKEMEHKALQRLIAKQQLSMYIHEGFWHSMDTYTDVNDLNVLWNSGKAPWKVW